MVSRGRGSAPGGPALPPLVLVLSHSGDFTAPIVCSAPPLPTPGPLCMWVWLWWSGGRSVPPLLRAASLQNPSSSALSSPAELAVPRGAGCAEWWVRPGQGCVCQAVGAEAPGSCQPARVASGEGSGERGGGRPLPLHCCQPEVRGPGGRLPPLHPQLSYDCEAGTPPLPTPKTPAPCFLGGCRPGPVALLLTASVRVSSVLPLG